MPTYTNTYSGIVELGDVIFGPNQVKELYQYLDLTKDDTGYISLTSDSPYVNPANETHTVTSSASSEVELNNWKVVEGVEIYNGSSSLITVYLTEVTNTPGIVVPTNTVRYIFGFKGGVKTLALTFGGTVSIGECYITELMNRSDCVLRSI